VVLAAEDTPNNIVHFVRYNSRFGHETSPRQCLSLESQLASVHGCTGSESTLLLRMRPQIQSDLPYINRMYGSSYTILDYT
jgi:hypothetical protein